jgi:hypothetical protein
MLIIILWFSCGLIGAGMLHWNWKWYFHEPFCPTPAEVLKCVLGSIFGPLILIAANIIWLFDLLSKRMKKWKWLHTPICKPK